MVTWSRQLSHALLLWALLSVLFVVGNEAGGSENTVSTFPSLISLLVLGTGVVWITKHYMNRLGSTRASQIVHHVSIVVLFVAVLMIPIASGYAFYYFEARPWRMVWSAAFMTFVGTFAIGYLTAWISAWILVKKGNPQT